MIVRVLWNIKFEEEYPEKPHTNHSEIKNYDWVAQKLNFELLVKIDSIKICNIGQTLSISPFNVGCWSKIFKYIY